MTSRPDTVEPSGSVVALRCFTVAVGIVTFALSFVGLYDYGRHVIGLHAWLAWLVPVGIDCLTLAAVAATFALRQAPKRVRLYAWLVFGVALAASVAGNLSHAIRRDLPLDGQIGAAAWPALLALASHLVVVTWRHIEQAPAAPPATRTPRQSAAAAAAVSLTKTKRTRRRGHDAATVARALAMIAKGDKYEDVAKVTGASERTLARWVAENRQQAAPALEAAPAT